MQFFHKFFTCKAKEKKSHFATMTGFMFNIDAGYLEGLCRGFKCGILKQSDYLNLVQCETLEGKKVFFLFSIESFAAPHFINLAV